MEEKILTGKQILVVDDEADLRYIVAYELEFMGADVFQVENISKAKDFLDIRPIDLIVSDIRMPGGTGIDLLNYIKTKNTFSPPIVLITGFADIPLENAFNQGAEALLSKPFRLDDLVELSAKLTSKIEDRYVTNRKFTTEPNKLSIKFNDSISEKISRGEFAIGRGGMSIMVINRSFKCDLGEVLDFKIIFRDLTLEGSAVCRWWKPDKNENSVFGFEFLHLSQETFNYFNSYWKDHTIIPFIPSLQERHI